MRKQTKLVAVLSAAALLAIGASMTSFAATGWAEEDGTWVYYNKDGDRVESEWQKSGNSWFYLNEDGEMATESLITDSDSYSNIYYVDANGAMVTNQWVEVENEDYSTGDEDASATVWYYFQANGKAYKTTNGKTSFKTINGKKYTFNADGHMLYGWVGADAERISGDEAWETGVYFCGDENDGAMATGWAQIHCIDDQNTDDEDQNYWFYFTSTGKKTIADSGKTNITKTINGKKYTFDAKGVMQSEWYQFYDASPASAATSYKYYNAPEDGHRMTKGWFNVVPSEKVNEDAYNDDSVKWFYADSDGDLYTNKDGIKSVNNKKYAFDANGEMLSGLQAIKKASNGTITSFKLDDADKISACTEKTTYTDSDGKTTNFADGQGWIIYYFGTADDGSMKYGTQNLTIDGDAYTYVFTSKGTKKGQGENGVIETKYIAANGQKVKADGDVKYQAVASDGIAVDAGDYTWSKIKDKYLVNSSGSIQKNKKSGVKDLNDRYYVTDKYGQIVAMYTKDDNKIDKYCGDKSAITGTFVANITESTNLN